MTTIDGERQPGTIPGLAPGALLDRIDELARLLHRSPMEVVVLAFADYTPAIEAAAGDIFWEDFDGRLMVPGSTAPILSGGSWDCTAHVNGVPCLRPATVLVFDERGYWYANAACALHVPKFAPPVDAGNMTPGSPGDGRGAGGVAATPAPVVTHVTEMPTTKEALAMSADLAKGMAEAAASIFQPQPVSHATPVHVHLGGGRCVYGERCGQ